MSAWYIRAKPNCTASPATRADFTGFFSEAARRLAANACNVAAFPVQRPAQHGWLPQLRFAPGEFEKLSSICGDAELCELEVEGTLKTLDLSGELPTSVHFDQVRVVGARKT